MEVFEAVRTMLAVRRYLDRAVPETIVQKIVEAGRLTGSAMNLQPWHFVVVQARGRAQVLLVQDDVPITLLKQPIIDQAARQSLPIFAQYREFVEAGALVTFAHALAGEYRQAASYVDRILRGTKPADLPIQQPTKFELILNLKTAKALGLKIPAAILALADEVIQ
jgi:putative ABC transport system substrate-binding protein